MKLMGDVIVPETVEECAIVTAANAMTYGPGDDPAFAAIRDLTAEWERANSDSEEWVRVLDTPTVLGLALAYALRERVPV